MANLLQERILAILREAHASGSLGEGAQQIAAIAGVSTDQILHARAEMLDLGFLDEVDDRTMLALSALGLRQARELAVPNATFATEAGDQDIVLYSRLRNIGQLWADQVHSSTLTETEKSRLIILGEELFTHPATTELLIRALS